MDPIDLLNLKQWFSRYCKSFSSDNEEERKNFALKEQHSLNVSAIMLSISQAVLQNRNKVLNLFLMLSDSIMPMPFPKDSILKRNSFSK